MEAFLKTGKLTADGKAKPEASASGPSTRGNRGPMPWVEKYRPRTINDVAFQEEVVAVLNTAIKGADLPNLLFYGPPGTGKTSTIMAVARDLFGTDMFRKRILELNASDERGINIIRDKVKRFAQQTATNRRPDGSPCPPFKIVILDEADSMTRDAQSALRRTMEKEGRSTKFCLICNYVSRIIEPLTSRCAKFRFKPLEKNVLIQRLEMIAKAENVNVEPEAMNAFLETSEGDLRKAITSLQSCARLKSPNEDSSGESVVTAEDVYEMSGVVPNPWIDRIIAVSAKNSFEKVQKLVNELTAEGFAVTQIFLQLHERTVQNPDLTDSQKSVICEALARNEYRLLDGANEQLQLLDMCAVLMKALAM